MKRLLLLTLLTPLVAYAEGWDGSGNVVRGDGTRTGATTWTQARDAGVKILAADHDHHDEVLATAIENCWARDGQNSPTADMPMGSNQITGLGDGAALTDACAVNQVQNSEPTWDGTAGGSADTYTLTLAPAPAAYAAGQEFGFLVDAAKGNTGAATLNVNSLGAVGLWKLINGVAVPLVAGDLAAGHQAIVRHDGTKFVLLNPGAPTIGARLVTAVTVANVATETAMFTYTIPGGVLGTNRFVHVKAYLTFNNDTGGNQNPAWSVKLGTTELATITDTLGAGSEWLMVDIFFGNLNSASSQIGYGGIAVGPLTIAEFDVVSASENTAVDKNLTINTTLGAASANLTSTLSFALVEIL